MEDEKNTIVQLTKKLIALRKELPAWIDCREDNPPATDETMLVYMPDAVETVGLGFYDGTQWRSADSVRLRDRVTHWMELPKAPNEEGDEA